MIVSTLGELAQALNEVEEQLQRALAQMHTGRTALEATASALTRLDPDHPETVVPTGLRHAENQLERTEHGVQRALEMVQSFRTSL